MAICKDCLHYEACKRFNEIRTNVINESKRGAENLCELYADKSRFVELPCKVGDVVYIANEWYKRTFSFNIVEICIYEEEIIIVDDSENEYHPEYFGKTVFLTREEAEAALAERMKKDDRT